MRVLAFDIGKCMGYGVLEGECASSGSRLVGKSWQPYGPQALRAELIIRETIKEFSPTHLAVAGQFVRHHSAKRQGDTAENLIPMYWMWMELHKIATQTGLPLEVINEREARKVMLGEKIPAGSDAQKQAVWQACLDRGWRCTDWNASDALCVAVAVTERLSPSTAHTTTPLFLAAPKRRRRRRAA